MQKMKLNDEYIMFMPFDKPKVKKISNTKDTTNSSITLSIPKLDDNQ